jgi:hypothetical protein
MILHIEMSFPVEEACHERSDQSSDVNQIIGTNPEDESNLLNFDNGGSNSESIATPSTPPQQLSRER